MRVFRKQPERRADGQTMTQSSPFRIRSPVHSERSVIRLRASSSRDLAVAIRELLCAAGGSSANKLTQLFHFTTHLVLRSYESFTTTFAMSSQSTLSKCLFLFIATFAIFFQIAAGLPVNEKRDVYVPPVLYPHSGTVWYKGQRHNVTW